MLRFQHTIGAINVKIYLQACDPLQLLQYTLYIKMKTSYIKMERDKNHQNRTLTFSCFAVRYKQLSFETQSQSDLKFSNEKQQGYSKFKLHNLLKQPGSKHNLHKIKTPSIKPQGRCIYCMFVSKWHKQAFDPLDPLQWPLKFCRQRKILYIGYVCLFSSKYKT